MISSYVGEIPSETAAKEKRKEKQALVKNVKGWRKKI